MVMLVVCPFTCHRSVDDCPRWIEPGSALNCSMAGAAGAGAGGGGATGGGGGGGGGTFFLQLAANTARVTASAMALNFRVLNINYPPELSNYLPQTGVQLLPCLVSCFTCEP